jgi:hypothetical protein
VLALLELHLLLFMINITAAGNDMQQPKALLAYLGLALMT